MAHTGFDPIKELFEKKTNLQKELEDKKMAWTLCYQHKKLYLHFLEMIEAILEGKELTKFEILKSAQKNFHETLLLAQESGEKMEKGLENRRAFLRFISGDGADFEALYQEFKGKVDQISEY